MDRYPILDHDGSLCPAVRRTLVNCTLTHRRILQVDQVGDVSDCGDIHHPHVHGMANDSFKRCRKDEEDCLFVDQLHRLLRW